MDLTELIRQLDNGIEVCTVSLETTGFSSKSDRIVSCGIIKGKLIRGILTETERFFTITDPEIPIPKDAAKIHGITNAVAARHMKQADLYRAIKPILEGTVVAAFASNLITEVFLKELYERNGDKFDPVGIVNLYEETKGKIDTEKRDFESVCRAIGADRGLHFHYGIDSAIGAARLLDYLIATYEKTTDLPLVVPEIVDYKYWAKGERIYVNTEPNIGKIHYDIRKKQWMGEGINFTDFEDYLLRISLASDMDDLVGKLKK